MSKNYEKAMIVHFAFKLDFTYETVIIDTIYHMYHGMHISVFIKYIFMKNSYQAQYLHILHILIAH